MASLRTYQAAKLLRSATTSRIATPLVARRFQSNVTSATGVVPTTEDQNQPDYEAPQDKATSTFTPVPKRVQNGSEDVPYIQAGVLSDAPMELQARTVRIYKEAKPATQSGNWQGHHWRMDWDILPKGHRWENPLMGWQSSADMMQGTKLNFKSKEDAIHFANKQGYEYFVQEPQSRKITPKAYANNFLYTPNKLKHIRTK